MIIKSLRLQNYRRFESLDLEFPENVIGMIGRNGAGKSTIIEAIGWALYGNRFVRTDKQDVRSQHVEDKSACAAEMIFEYGGSEFLIQRKLKGKNAISEAAIYRDGQTEPAAVQDRGVNEFIEALLQLDYRSFTTSVFAQQKELAKLSTLQPEQRRQAINRLINIDRIDRAREQVRRDRNEKLTYINGQKSALRDEDELRHQETVLREQITEKQTNLTDQQKRVETQKESLAAAKAAFEAWNKLRDQFNTWESQIGKLQSRLESAQDTLTRSQTELQEISAAETQLATVQESLQEFERIKTEKERLDLEKDKAVHLKSRLTEKTYVQDSLAKEQAALADAETKAKDVADLETRWQQLTKREETLEQQVHELQEEIKRHHGLKISAESKGKELREKLARIQELGPNGECPVCTRPLGEHFAEVEQDHRQQLAKLRVEFKMAREAEDSASATLKEREAELRQLRKQKDETLKALRGAQDAQAQVEKIKEHLSNYEQQLELLDKAIAEIGPVDFDEERHRELKQRYEELLKLQQQAAKLEERVARRGSVQEYIQSTSDTIEQLEQDIKTSRAAQADLGFDDAEFQTAKTRVDDTSQALESAREQLSALQQELALLQRDAENVAQQISEQQRIRAQIKQMEEDIVYLNALDEHFGHFRLDLAGRIRPLIAQRASELLALTTTSRYSQLDLDADYNIRIFDANRAFPIERFSGGEQDLANLCLRIAISQVVAERSGGAPINFIVLDEIFGSQDVERRDLILNALAQLSSQFRQILIITHTETVKDVLPVIIHVETVDDQTSQATLI